MGRNCPTVRLHCWLSLSNSTGFSMQSLPPNLPLNCPNCPKAPQCRSGHSRAVTHFVSRTTKSGEGAAKPAVTAYSAPPNSAMVVGTFVNSFDVNGSVMKRTMAPD